MPASPSPSCSNGSRPSKPCCSRVMRRRRKRGLVFGIRYGLATIGTPAGVWLVAKLYDPATAFTNVFIVLAVLTLPSQRLLSAAFSPGRSAKADPRFARSLTLSGSFHPYVAVQDVSAANSGRPLGAGEYAPLLGAHEPSHERRRASRHTKPKLLPIRMQRCKRGAFRGSGPRPRCPESRCRFRLHHAHAHPGAGHSRTC